MRSLQSELIRHGFRPSKRRVWKNRTRTKEQCSEQLTNRELVKLMGLNRDTYKRVNGRIRSR